MTSSSEEASEASRRLRPHTEPSTWLFSPLLLIWFQGMQGWREVLLLKSDDLRGESSDEMMPLACISGFGSDQPQAGPQPTAPEMARAAGSWSGGSEKKQPKRCLKGSSIQAAFPEL